MHQMFGGSPPAGKESAAPGPPGGAVPTPNREPRDAKRARTSIAGGSRQETDAATGKRLQRRVNENKHKEDAKRKAAELLEANAGKFASLQAPEDVEEPLDEGAGDDVAESAWDTATRVQEAAAAWPESDQDPLSGGGAKADAPAAIGRLPFTTAAAVLEMQQGAGRAATIRGVATLLGKVLRNGQAGELAAAVRVLLASRNGLSHRAVADSIACTFQLTEKATRAVAPNELAEYAQSVRARQRMLFKSPKRLSLLEVGNAMRAASAPTPLPQLAGSGGVAESRGPQASAELVKLFGAAVADDREMWHLTRVMQGVTKLSWDVVVRGLAHAVALVPASTSAEGGTSVDKLPELADRAASLVAFEDEVAQAFVRVGMESDRLCEALVAGKRGVDLLADCCPTVGVPVAHMQAECQKDIAVGIERIGRVEAVLAEMLVTGERVQVHLQDGGKQITVFDASMKPRPDRVEIVEQVLAGHLLDVDSCIMDVIFPRGSRVDTKYVTTEESAASVAKAADPSATGTETGHGGEEQETPQAAIPVSSEADAKSEAKPEIEAGQTPAVKPADDSLRVCMVSDLLLLNGRDLMMEPLRERRAELSKVVQLHSRLRLVSASEIPAGTLDLAVASAKLDEALGAAYLTCKEDRLFSRSYAVVMKRLDGPGSAYVAGRRSEAWQQLERPPIVGAEADRILLTESLSEEDQKFLPSADEFHFSVVSGFRTRSVEGIKDILNIQKLYNDAGVAPTWYVDNECPDEYRKLGLKVVKAGKLLPARNHALEDAFKMNKICVQTSDDIGSWQFLNDETKYSGTDEDSNAAWKKTIQLHVSPVAAARFMCAKMRKQGVCKLAGVYPLSNGGRSMRAEAYSRFNFILGDFFVAEVSPCRFDENLSLKEDYDFTCSHLEKYGEVLRVNRMLITAKHETNAGGACDVRDAAGEREKYNIRILKEKWPGAIKDHPTRANQIVLRWKSLGKEVKSKPVPTEAVEAVAVSGVEAAEPAKDSVMEVVAEDGKPEATVVPAAATTSQSSEGRTTGNSDDTASASASEALPVTATACSPEDLRKMVEDRDQRVLELTQGLTMARFEAADARLEVEQLRRQVAELRAAKRK